MAKYFITASAVQYTAVSGLSAVLVLSITNEDGSPATKIPAVNFSVSNLVLQNNVYGPHPLIIKEFSETGAHLGGPNTQPGFYQMSVFENLGGVSLLPPTVGSILLITVQSKGIKLIPSTVPGEAPLKVEAVLAEGYTNTIVFDHKATF